jgi:hypothetical protein
MGNRRKSREYRLNKDREDNWEKLRTQPRRFGERSHAFGVGKSLIQIATCPSFEECRCWDICECKSNYTLYSSKAEHMQEGVIVVGFEPVEFSSEKLQQFINRLYQLKMPIKPARNNLEGLDGVSFHLVLFGDLYSAVRFDWWCDPPPGWEEMAGIVGDMLGAFSAASPLILNHTKPDPLR